MDEGKQERTREPPVARPRVGATRCPYCHEDCEASAASCACADCLSRHHQGCWEESRGCASCRSPRRLTIAPAGAAETPVEKSPMAQAVDAWVKLGFAYNAVLVSVTFLAVLVRLGVGMGVPASFLIEIPIGAAIANVCFLLGPVIDLVARWLGYRGRGLRWFLFLSGLAFASLLAFFSVMNAHARF